MTVNFVVFGVFSINCSKLLYFRHKLPIVFTLSMLYDGVSKYLERNNKALKLSRRQRRYERQQQYLHDRPMGISRSAYERLYSMGIGKVFRRGTGELESKGTFITVNKRSPKNCRISDGLPKPVTTWRIIDIK